MADVQEVESENTDIAAFFDLDRTLIDCNSGMEWARHEFGEGNISLWQLGQATVWMGLYHLALIDMKKAFDQAVAHYEGVPRRLVDSRTRSWFHRHIAERLRDGAAEAVERHRRADHHLVILTNSSCFEARVATEVWGFDDYLANEFPCDDDGRLLGEFEEPLCYGAGKVERAEAWAEERGVDLDNSYFYSDSYSDLPMLERVAEPRIVDPDPRLSRTARDRRWPVLDW